MTALQRLTTLVLFTLTTLNLFSQETTATLAGSVTDSKGELVPGATVSVTHVPTGYHTTTLTNNKGLFAIPNLKPGGPYTVIISFVGTEEQKFENINLTLGSNPDVNVSLKNNDKSLEEVVVSATGRRTIAGMSISRSQMNILPTLGRSLTDYTRLTPQSNNNAYAGSNFRYNNLTIDGAINNDAIGFSNSFGGVSGGGQSGAAGSGTRTNPYSLDVIQEVQVQLSPYDVKLGNFTGGSVNAVTKSGTNDFHGSIYGYGRNQALVGKSVDGLKTKIGSTFHDYQWGATISGPIQKNKAFYIVNYEQTPRKEPTFYNAGDPGAAVSVADATSIYDRLKTAYNYDAGSYLGPYTIFTNSDKLFARLDFNLNEKNTLTIRGIYTNSKGNNLERTSTNFQFGSTDFTQFDKNVNLVAELKTKVSNNLSNQFNVSYIHVHEYRDFPGVLSPLMDIGGGAVWTGTWREASIYNMTQHTIEVSDNITLNKGINKFTFGTHNEFYGLTYGFINSWNGRWEYSNLNNFLADKPSRIRGAYTIDPKYPNDRDALFNNPPNPFNVNLMSLYGQDEISVNRDFKLTAGLRLDYPFLGKQIPVDKDFATAKNNTPHENSTYTNTPFNEFTNKWLGKPTLSPRIGFSWNVNGNKNFVLRGGSGIFVGRMPFAWLGYAETLTGGVYNNIDFRPSATNTVGGSTVIPIAIDPLHLKDTIDAHALPSANATNTREVDVIDNHFKLPTILRSNLAADFKFGKGYKLTLDALYTKTLYDVRFQQINIKDSVQYFSTGPVNSPVYVGGKLNSQYSNVYLLTNTNSGYRYNLTAQISKSSSNNIASRHIGINWSVAYTYGMSKDISNGIRNSFQSNFEVNPAIVPNNAPLAFSNFDLRHRIVATFGSTLNWNASNSTSLSFFYAGQSGSPYSVVYNSGGAPFGNAANANLPYIPANQGDINLKDKKDANGNVTYSAAQQWTDLSSLIEGDKYLKTRKGQYADRNALRTPWNHELDMKLMHEFKLGKDHKHSLQLSFDLFNVLNLLSNDWGHIYFVTNVNNYTVNLLTFVADANGVAPGKPSSGYIPTFNFNKPTGLNGHYYTVDPLNSRWQGQFGVKYNF